MLLADLHVHTRWSDGKLTIAEVVDLFGRSGHDVIAITDHIVNEDSLIGKATHRFGLTITPTNFASYLAEIESEARRAWDRYRMLVLPGAELTQNRVRRNESAHVLVLGIDSFIPADGTVDEMLRRARRSAPVVVACHPHEQSEYFANTFYLWNRRDEVRDLIDLWELATRWDLFPPVARARLPFVGNSDFHDRPHLDAWKTLLPCAKTTRDVMATLKRGAGLAVTRLSPHRIENAMTVRTHARAVAGGNVA
ncbi:MAG: PHP domain-containing protein [Thermoanaerobaculia bacterium]